MSGCGSLNAAQGSFVEAFLVHFGKGGAARVGVIETAVCSAVEENGAVGSRDEGEDVEGGDCVD